MIIIEKYLHKAACILVCVIMQIGQNGPFEKSFIFVFKHFTNCNVWHDKKTWTIQIYATADRIICMNKICT